MQVVKLNSNVPIKAIPDEELNRILFQEFAVWLSGLLSLADQKSASRLEAALPAVKQHCWSMGFAEIKKMFEMYADNKLSIKPKSNYFDRVLFGQIVEAYKAQKQPTKKIYEPEELTQEEKDVLVYSGCVNCYDAWYQDKRIIPGYTWVYDHLDEKGVLNYSKDEKKEAMKEAKIRLKTQRTVIEKSVSKIEGGEIAEAKRILLEKYFESTTKDEFLKQL